MSLPERMSVREYAKLKGLQPQLVYYYIRQGYIDEEPCHECGRKVIVVKQADDYLAKRKAKKWQSDSSSTTTLA